MSKMRRAATFLGLLLLAAGARAESFVKEDAGKMEQAFEAVSSDRNCAEDAAGAGEFLFASLQSARQAPVVIAQAIPRVPPRIPPAPPKPDPKPAPEKPKERCTEVCAEFKYDPQTGAIIGCFRFIRRCIFG